MRLLLLLLCIVILISTGSAQDSLPVVGAELEPFAVSLSDLEKDAQPMTTLSEQCKRFVKHYRYYCKTSNIAKYNEEVRIICERYRAYCSDRVYPAVNHIRRQVIMWEKAGIPANGIRALEKCYMGCKQTDPVCVNACECVNLQWIMDYSCNPGSVAPAAPNCVRWAQKCRSIWRPIPDFTPAHYSEMAPPPIVRGIFYGYNGLETHKIFDKPRDHGVSFWRGTQTTLVDWLEGKMSYSNTWDVPFAGVEGTWPSIGIGFPSLQKAMREFTKENPDPTNPGTGRARSVFSTLRRQ